LASTSIVCLWCFIVACRCLVMPRVSSRPGQRHGLAGAVVLPSLCAPTVARGERDALPRQHASPTVHDAPLGPARSRAASGGATRSSRAAGGLEVAAPAAEEAGVYAAAVQVQRACVRIAGVVCVHVRVSCAADLDCPRARPRPRHDESRRDRDTSGNPGNR
jgi:hypothetical protein